MRVAVVTALLAAGIAQAQTRPPVAFDFASITRNLTDKAVPLVSGFPATTEGVSTIWNATTEQIIGFAYRIKTSATTLVRSDGLTFDWDARFDIVARPPNGTSAEQQYTMLRRLLADRFKLRVHTEKRPMPAYALTVERRGRLGPQLRRSRIDCTAPYNNPARLIRLIEGRDVCGVPDDGSISNVKVLRSAGAMSLLAQSLRATLDRPVLDETRLAGMFEWKLSFARTQADADANATQISTALQQQLGLKLERKTASVEFLVVDSVEMPTEDDSEPQFIRLEVGGNR